MLFNLYCRIFQTVMKIASGFLPWRKPVLIKGEGSLLKLPELVAKCQINRVLIVTDQVLLTTGLLNKMLRKLKELKIRYVIYDKTVQNPTIDNIEEALKLFKDHRCRGIIGFGGGSSMDCAKGVAARVARPDKTIARMKGILKIRKKTPTLFAVPTTAGTGSEATLAAVIVDSRTHEKYPVSDFPLIPEYAVLDPLLTRKLPSGITATTGMDALTHAVEAYIGRSNTAETRSYSQMAVKLIFDNLEKAFMNGDNLLVRKNIQLAAYYAGVAFTRAYVGNVHAIAHTLGGFYSIPHGLANAVILPYVLEYYGYRVHKPLAQLADLVGLGHNEDSDVKKAERFIKQIRTLNQRMGIPDKISGIQEKDIEVMAQRAFKEANPLYPVPVIFTLAEFKYLYYIIKE